MEQQLLKILIMKAITKAVIEKNSELKKQTVKQFMQKKLNPYPSKNQLSYFTSSESNNLLSRNQGCSIS